MIRPLRLLTATIALLAASFALAQDLAPTGPGDIPATHLRDRKPPKPLSPVTAFETGANEWREYQAWPPRANVSSTKLYLQPQGKLQFAAPPQFASHTLSTFPTR